MNIYYTRLAVVLSNTGPTERNLDWPGGTSPSEMASSGNLLGGSVCRYFLKWPQMIFYQSCYFLKLHTQYSNLVTFTNRISITHVAACSEELSLKSSGALQWRHISAQITNNLTVCSTVYSYWHQRHRSCIFPSQRASNEESVSTSWRLHEVGDKTGYTYM